MCLSEVCLWCISVSINFPSVSWYQSVFRQSKVTWDFFLLPYGNKCHVFFPMSLIALSAVQFSKYLPLSAESLLRGKLFLNMYSPVLCAAKACAWGVRYQGAARGGCLWRALCQDPCMAAAKAQGWQPGSAQSPDPQASPQWWGQAGMPHWPWALAAKPPRAGLLSGHVHWACRIAHVWKYLLDLDFEIIEANNPYLIDEICERTEIAVVVYCFWIRTESVLGCVLHDACDFQCRTTDVLPGTTLASQHTLALVMAHLVVFTVHWSRLLNKQKWANLIFLGIIG